MRAPISSCTKICAWRKPKRPCAVVADVLAIDSGDREGAVSARHGAVRLSTPRR